MSFDLQQLKLAFAHHIVVEITRADTRLHPRERQFFNEVFPLSLMQQRGLMDEAGAATAEFHEAHTEALRRLPTELSADAKRDLIRLFLRATVVDGAIDPSETLSLQQAAAQLGLNDTDFWAVLDSLDMVGEIELDEPDDA